MRVDCGHVTFYNDPVLQSLSKVFHFLPDAIARHPLKLLPRQQHLVTEDMNSMSFRNNAEAIFNAGKSMHHPPLAMKTPDCLVNHDRTCKINLGLRTNSKRAIWTLRCRT